MVARCVRGCRNLMQTGVQADTSGGDGFTSGNTEGCQSRRGVAQCVPMGDDCERTDMVSATPTPPLPLSSRTYR